MATYTVKAGESLFDICYNTTGWLTSIDSIMDANNISDYTPQLAAGTIILVPDAVYDSSAVESANKRPFNSTSEPLDFTSLENILNQ